MSGRLVSFLTSVLELCCLLIALCAAGYGAFTVFFGSTRAPVELIAERAATIDSVQRSVADSRTRLRFHAREVAGQAGELLGAEPGSQGTSHAPRSGNGTAN